MNNNNTQPGRHVALKGCTIHTIYRSYSIDRQASLSLFCCCVSASFLTSRLTIGSCSLGAPSKKKSLPWKSSFRLVAASAWMPRSSSQVSKLMIPVNKERGWPEWSPDDVGGSGWCLLSIQKVRHACRMFLNK